ncbi:hypothetical protein I3W98_29165, partial [Streptomyces cavourensis]|nr:hypothetical protein [Streptomyces cavourensis]
MTRGPFGGRRVGARALLGLGLTLALALPLTGCGSGSGGDKARVPEGWSTLDTDSLSVGYPKNEGYAEQPAAERSGNNAAVALKVEDGIRTGMVSVQLD